MITNERSLFGAFAGVLAIVLLAAAPASAEDAPGSMISGSFNFDMNTNFMSYGADVWGTDSFDDIIMNPSLGIDFDLGGGFSANTGVWFDWNDNAGSNIGNDWAIQEVDVWIGFGYSVDDFSIGLTYQEWMYNQKSERIVDFTLGYDHFLAPSLTVHGRVQGQSGSGRGQDEGAVFVVGVEPGTDLEWVSLSLPIAAGFVTKDYYVSNEGGFGYFSAGGAASLPLSFVSNAYGDWAFSAGVTYYHTSDDNIGNPKDDFVTASFGVGVAF